MSGPGCLQSPGFRHGWLAERGKKKVPRGGASGIRETIKALRRRTRRQGCRGRGVYSHRGFAMDGWQSVKKRKPLAEWAFGFDVEVHCIHLNLRLLRLLPILRDLDITYVRVWRHPAR